MTYRECYECGRRALGDAGISEAGLDARLLLEHVCHTDRNTLLAHGDREVTPEERDSYMDLVRQRGSHIPLQHLTGVQEFMGLSFQVGGQVLIPRQDTEILVEEVLREVQDGMRILDLCTGSGCILISLLKYTNGCTGLGVDNSEDALRIAGDNAARILRPDAEITFLQSDLFEKVTGQYEFIVSNPPYIRRGEIAALMPEVRDHEPKAALDGGEDGLDFYRRIVVESREYLVGGGMLYFEIGCDQAQEVTALMEQAGFMEIHVVKDYAGLDRVVYGTWLRPSL